VQEKSVCYPDGATFELAGRSMVVLIEDEAREGE
jgi:hypothetical protein